MCYIVQHKGWMSFFPHGLRHGWWQISSRPRTTGKATYLCHIETLHDLQEKEGESEIVQTKQKQNTTNQE